MGLQTANMNMGMELHVVQNFSETPVTYHHYYHVNTLNESTIHHPFWNQFPPPPDWMFILNGTWATIIAIFAIFGNGFVMLVFWR